MQSTALRYYLRRHAECVAPLPLPTACSSPNHCTLHCDHRIRRASDKRRNYNYTLRKSLSFSNGDTMTMRHQTNSNSLQRRDADADSDATRRRDVQRRKIIVIDYYIGKCPEGSCCSGDVGDGVAGIVWRRVRLPQCSRTPPFT